MKTEFYFKLINGEEVRDQYFSFMTKNGYHTGGIKGYQMAIDNFMSDHFAGVHVTEFFGDVTTSLRFIPSRSILMICKEEE